ncbi:hypothetical protein ACFL3V_02425 [Nanoarchaeota archaeon]
MKAVILLISFFLFGCFTAEALGIGVVPDRLVFDGEEEVFSIVNPNDSDVEFGIKNEFIGCVPAKGKIEAKGKAIIVCTAVDPSSRETHILVETKQKGGQVGVLPAVAIKAEIKGESEAGDVGVEPVHEEKELDFSGPLVIEGAVGESNETEDAALDEFSIMKHMKPELVSVVFLTLAILSVLAYDGVKKKKDKNKKSQEKKN